MSRLENEMALIERSLIIIIYMFLIN